MNLIVKGISSRIGDPAKNLSFETIANVSVEKISASANEIEIASIRNFFKFELDFARKRDMNLIIR